MKQITKQKLQVLHDEMYLQGYSKPTIKAYMYNNQRFLNFINKSPRDITTNDIKSYIKYLTDKKYERSSINLIISSLIFYYKTILHRNFKIKRQRAKKKLFDVLSRNEIDKLFYHVNNAKHRLVLNILYYTGVRVSELINIKLNDIDIERNMLHVRNGKGSKDRFIFINEKLKAELVKYISSLENLFNENLYLFHTRHKTKYSVRSIQIICKIYLI